MIHPSQLVRPAVNAGNHRTDSVKQVAGATTGDAPSCSTCGMLMVPNGSCYKSASTAWSTGSTSGCSLDVGASESAGWLIPWTLYDNTKRPLLESG